MKHKKNKFLIKKSIFGTSERPRLSIFKSHKHIYAQLIDDSISKTIASCSTLQSFFIDMGSNKKTAAFKVGLELAQIAICKGVFFVVFDRGNFPFAGRIRSLANGAKFGGLLF